MSSTIRHEWYQTEQKVVVSVFIKDAQKRNCKIDIESESFSVEADEIPRVEFKLRNPINAAESSFKLYSVKVEISLKKLSGERWDTLERIAGQEPQPTRSIQLAESAKTACAAPKDHKDWDKLVKDIWEKEDLEKVSKTIGECKTRLSAMRLRFCRWKAMR